MSKQHISGADTHISIGNHLLHVTEFSLSLEDGVSPTYKRGIPDGTVAGQVAASGEIGLDTENFNLLMASAKRAGSFQQLDPVDIVGQGQTVSQSFEVAAYGCKLKLTNVLDMKDDGGEKLMHKVPFDVTDSRFVEINGTPYLDSARTRTLLG